MECLNDTFLFLQQTNSTQLKPSSDVNRHAASQTIPHTICNPRFTAVCNFPPLVPVLNKINSVHVLPSSLFQIHFNIILPSTHRPSKQSHSFRFPYQNFLFVFILPHMCPMPHPYQIGVILSPNYLARSPNN
jgi:hypothetical protein